MRVRHFRAFWRLRLPIWTTKPKLLTNWPMRTYSLFNLKLSILQFFSPFCFEFQSQTLIFLKSVRPMSGCPVYVTSFPVIRWHYGARRMQLTRRRRSRGTPGVATWRTQTQLLILYRPGLVLQNIKMFLAIRQIETYRQARKIVELDHSSSCAILNIRGFVQKLLHIFTFKLPMMCKHSIPNLIILTTLPVLTFLEM